MYTEKNIPEHEFSLNRMFRYIDRIYDSILIQENTSHRKPVFSHILRSIIRESSVNNFKAKIHFESLLNTGYCSKYGVCDLLQNNFFSSERHRLICSIQKQFCQLYIWHKPRLALVGFLIWLDMLFKSAHMLFKSVAT